MSTAFRSNHKNRQRLCDKRRISGRVAGNPPTCYEGNHDAEQAEPQAQISNGRDTAPRPGCHSTRPGACVVPALTCWSAPVRTRPDQPDPGAMGRAWADWGDLGVKLKMLKPRLATLSTDRVRVLDQRIGATPRQSGRKWMEVRAAWLSNHPLCVGCECKGYVRPAAVVDHVIPLWEGGADDESNYQSLCNPCHDEKTAAEATRRAGGG